jgi:hypothetical protein
MNNKQKEKQRESNRKSYYKNKERRLRWTKQYNLKVREEVVRHYGGKCQCCGESEIVFLAIDHIEGGGHNHRKELGFSGMRFYFWVRKNGYPKNLRILCHNCNQATSWGRKCPHELLTPPQL